MTKPVEITQREMLKDMHGRLAVLESTAEHQSAQFLQMTHHLQVLVRINRSLVEDNRRLIRAKETLLEMVGRDALIQKHIDNQEIEWPPVSKPNGGA